MYFDRNTVAAMNQAGLQIAIALLLSLTHVGFAAGTNGDTNAPTGLYASVSDLPERFVVQLSTNGTYKVHATGLRTNSQSGVWKWDDKRQQFLLTPDPNNSSFSYEFRRLRVDQRQPDTLQWLPLHGTVTMEGAIDYVRLKRKDE